MQQTVDCFHNGIADPAFNYSVVWLGTYRILRSTEQVHVVSNRVQHVVCSVLASNPKLEARSMSLQASLYLYPLRRQLALAAISQRLLFAMVTASLVPDRRL